MEFETRRRALVGAASWLLTPWLPFARPPAFGSIEHVFLSLPLITMPFALALLSTLAGHRYAWARRLEPFAAAMLLAGFLLAQGLVAALLTAGWAVLAVSIAIAAVRARVRGPSLIAAHVFLLLGAAWLVVSRLGVIPPNFGPLTAMLAALHFHFSGFALQILLAASGRRRIAIVAIVAIPLIAAGNLAALPLLKFVGVAAMVLATTSLAVLSLRGRPLSTISSASLLAGMLLAGVYGVGELLGAGWIGVPRMAMLHGLLNALGFTLCGLIARLSTCSCAATSRTPARAC